MEKGNRHHLNDKTIKYKTYAQARRQHEYFGLPGSFKTHYPQEIIFPNMESGRLDELYSTSTGMLIDLEEESGKITEETLEKFGKYIRFISYMYSKNVYLAVICHVDPKRERETYRTGPSSCIEVHYYYLTQEQLREKYENLINKVQQKKELNDTESLDIAFIAKFIAKEHAKEVTESLARIFNDAIIPDMKLRIDVAIIFGGMILRHFPDRKTQDRLLEMIHMREYENEMEKIIYEEFGDTLSERDRKIEEMARQIKNKDDEIDKVKKTNQQYKNKIRQLQQLKGLTSEAEQIINSLMLL